MKNQKFKYTLGKGVLIGAVLGIIAGLVLKDQTIHFKIIGDLFLRLMQLPVILLIMSVMIEAVGSLNPKTLGKLGGKTLILFAVTTALAAVLGLTMATIFQPGVGLSVSGALDAGAYTIPEPASFTDQLLGFVSTNVFAAMAGGNTLQCMVAAVLFGVTLSIYGSKHEKNPVLQGVKHLNEILMLLIGLFVQLLPFATFSFLSYAVGVVGPQLLGTLAKLIIANLVGAIILYAVYGIFASLYCKVSPLRTLTNSTNTALVALIVNASAAAMPTKLEDGEKKFGISPLVNRLVAPLGTTMNTDGMVLFFALSCLTIAQIYEIPITLSLMVNIVISGTLLSFGTMTVPGGGFVMLGMCLTAVGLPTAGLPIIAAADVVMGPIRTVNNCVDDIFTGMVVAKSEDEFDPDIFYGKKEFDPTRISYKHTAETVSTK